MISFLGKIYADIASDVAPKLNTIRHFSDEAFGAVVGGACVGIAAAFFVKEEMGILSA